MTTGKYRRYTSKLLVAGAVAFGCGSICTSANAWEQAITDTNGYVVQSDDDKSGQDSIINGAHFPGGAPEAGKNYLVNRELTTRTPGTDNADNTFKGDSFTLDEGARFLLKGRGSKITIADLRIYNAKISQGDGNSLKTLKGGMTVYGTPTAPSIIEGSGNSGVRRFSIESAISGASGTRIKVQHSDETDSPGAQFYTFLKGDNSDYLGSFEVESAGNGICLVGFNNKAFGSSPDITLTNNGKLFGGGSGTISLSGAAIKISNGGLLGVYSKSGSDVGLSIEGGSTISGTGVLTINNSGAEGDHSRRVQLGGVTITGIDRIQVDNGVLQLASGYDNATIPITVTQQKMFRTHAGINAGPVTLKAGSNIDSANGNISLASLTLEATEAGAPFIRKFLSSGVIAIDCDLENKLGSGGKIRIDFTVIDISQLAAQQEYRVLSAANLGDPGVTATDFVATADNADEYVRAAVTNGTFSIKTDGGVSYLLYTLPHKIVYTQGTDGAGSGDNGSSFQTGKRWSDKALPHSDADYFVFNGATVRALDGSTATFNGHSLSVLSGGQFFVQGATVTVNDMRLYGGSRLFATRTAGNILAGNVAIFGSTTDPVIFQIEVNKGPNEPYRALQLRSPISGSGSVRCIYAPGHVNDSYTPSVDYPGKFDIRGDNRGFTGEWQLSHFAIQGTFKSAENIGSASAVVFCSNAVFRAEAASFETPSATRFVVNNTGSVAGSEEKTNGGTFLVDANQTLTVNGIVSGAGILRKTGTGTLRLNAQNTISGNVVVKAGNIGGTGKVNTLELADGTGFDVSATQATPFEIGSLIVDGAIALHIRDAANADLSRIAVAKVGTLTGTLASAKATVDGGRGGTYRLSISNGILYAEKPGLVLVVW